MGCECAYACSRNGILKFFEIAFMLVAFAFVMNVIDDVLNNPYCNEIVKDFYGYRCVPNEYSVFVALTFIVAVNVLLLLVIRTLSDTRIAIRYELVCCFFEFSFVIIAVVVLTSRIVQYSKVVRRELIGVVIAFLSFPLFLLDAHFAYQKSAIMF
ncbi:uncharacterized protein [Antedon mediterranea]|uniref:uncharacterized protein n=1 Tax=Antedon mediterranea TaxID=105859 RepID=UPI003AF86499